MEQKKVTSLKGLLYIKQGRLGSDSEGPDYYLQTKKGDFMLEYKQRNLWEPDYHLEFYSRRMVVVFGKIITDTTIKVETIEEICESLIPE